PRRYTPSLHDALPISIVGGLSSTTGVDGAGMTAAATPTTTDMGCAPLAPADRCRSHRSRVERGEPAGSTSSPLTLSEGIPTGRRSEEHTSELQSPDHL